MKLAIFGSSGMARSIVDIADGMKFSEIVFVDKNSGVESILGIEIAAEKDVPLLKDEGFVFAMGIGNNSIRKSISMKFPDINFVNVVHPSVSFGRKSKENLERTSGNILMAGAVFSGNISFGDFGLYNFNCVVGHDVHFGQYVHLGPGSIVCGNVDVHDEAYIWSGAMVRNGGGDQSRIVIGEKAQLGMGAVALGDVPPGTSVPPNRTFVGRQR